MEIVYFHKKRESGGMSIEGSFLPLIERMAEGNNVRQLNVPYYAGSDPIKMLKNILYIRKNSTKNGINHITGDIHYGILGLVGRKSILTIHDDYAIRQVKRGGVLNKFFKWLFWYYLPIKLSDATVCITPGTLKNILALYNSNKIKVITHHCVSPLFNDKGKRINKQCPVLLQIGTDNNKNLETTLKVVSRLKCKLVVLKPMTKRQHSMAQGLNIDYVNKYDLPFEEVVAEYDNCDVVLFPSLFEGLGMPIFEGQASGKPVITSNREAMNWTAGRGAYLLEDPLDVEEYYAALIRIIQDDTYRETLIKEGKMNIKRFSLDKAVSLYLELYQGLFKDKNYENSI